MKRFIASFAFVLRPPKRRPQRRRAMPIYANAWGKSLHCIINRTTLRFKTPQGDISADNIDSIRISHHWSYDELHITMADGSIKTITLENAKIQVSDNGRISTYALCKLDYIELGRTLNR